MIEILVAIYLAAAKYDISADYLQCVARYESSFDAEAVGDAGLAVGLYQWHPDSWKWAREKMGRDSDLELRKEPSEAAETAAYIMSEYNLYRWWSADRLCQSRR